MATPVKVEKSLKAVEAVSWLKAEGSLWTSFKHQVETFVLDPWKHITHNSHKQLVGRFRFEGFLHLLYFQRYPKVINLMGTLSSAFLSTLRWKSWVVMCRTTVPAESNTTEFPSRTLEKPGVGFGGVLHGPSPERWGLFGFVCLPCLEVLEKQDKTKIG